MFLTVRHFIVDGSVLRMAEFTFIMFLRPCSVQCGSDQELSV